MPIRVLIVDNQTLLREGIKAVLRRARDIEVIGEGKNSTEAIDRAVALSPDIVLIEHALPDGDGIAAIRAIKERCPRTRILVLSSQGNPEAFGQTAAAGALGYIMKDISADNLANAIQSAYEGRTILSPTIAQRIVEQLSRTEENSGARSDRGILHQQHPLLSGHEIEVLVRVAHGLSDKEIAAQLFLSEAAVKTRLRQLYRRLGLKNRAHAAIFALEKGLLRLDAAR
jgi:two-component system NarL family response regulator